jgi:hypothetical protein
MSCQHLLEASQRSEPVKPSSHGCVDCLAAGSSWVHLRLCLTCGHVGCCDSSPNRHATRHFHDTRHPVVRSYEPGEDWAWCYVHEGGVSQIAALRGEAARVHYDPPRR